MQLVTLFASNGQTNHKGYEFLKVHLSIPIGVQIFHNLVNGGGVLLRLQKETKIFYLKIKKRLKIHLQYITVQSLEPQQNLGVKLRRAREVVSGTLRKLESSDVMSSLSSLRLNVLLLPSLPA